MLLKTKTGELIRHLVLEDVNIDLELLHALTCDAAVLYRREWQRSPTPSWENNDALLGLQAHIKVCENCAVIAVAHRMSK